MPATGMRRCGGFATLTSLLAMRAAFHSRCACAGTAAMRGGNMQHMHMARTDSWTLRAAWWHCSTTRQGCCVSVQELKVATTVGLWSRRLCSCTHCGKHAHET